MNAVAFDTLNASRRLREAGMDERTAEAIVEVVKQTAGIPGIDHLATKEDLDQLRTATKADLDQHRTETKADLDQHRTATKADLNTGLESLEHRLAAQFSEKLRTQGWALLGGMAAIVAAPTAIIKLAP